MMRIHFSPADLRRTTIAASPHAMFETAISLRQIRVGTSPHLADWRTSTRRVLPPSTRMLAELVPPARYLPDFLIPIDGRGDFESSLEQVAGAPTALIAQNVAELADYGNTRTPSRWLRELAGGSTAARKALVAGLREYHNVAIRPSDAKIRARLAADRAMRAEMLLRGGIDALLSTIHPTWGWQPPVLSVPFPGDFEVHLCGGGLVLTPSDFAVGPALLCDDVQQFMLIYPISVEDPQDVGSEALGALLGRTRAGVLGALRDPTTTTGLAERLNISLASASQHATVLRNNGLVSTVRMGGAVLHTVTPLGSALLQGEHVGSR